MAACNLTPTPDDPFVDFQGTPGTVTLDVNGSVGSVQIIRANYNNVPIPGLPSNRITFTVVAGQSTLDVVYFFSDQQAGAGTLGEVCDAHTPLKAISAAHPAAQYEISA